MSDSKAFDVALVQPDGIISAAKYTSPNGEPPAVGDVILVDEHGGKAHVTAADPDLDPPIYAELLT
jgi:hypothetical protein